MKKYKTVYVHGKFKHYWGETDYCIAAVSIPVDNPYYEWEKTLNLGFSIRKPKDPYNPNAIEDKYSKELAETIAYGKAIKKPAKMIGTTDPGIINDYVVKAILEKEMEYFEKNPGSVIAGYNEAKRKYENSLIKGAQLDVFN